MRKKEGLSTMRLDKRRKYFMILDCETATLPYANNFNDEIKKKIAIAKPLIYDLGWTIIDRTGKVYKSVNYLIAEVFSVPSIFNTAYYASKRPIYLKKMREGTISVKTWYDVVEELIEDMEEITALGAYNSMFDFKKAIPFTELYINNLYSDNYNAWEKLQEESCSRIAQNIKFTNERVFDKGRFIFRNKTYPLFDLWGMACNHLINIDHYKNLCLENDWITESGKYFKTSAETTFRYIDDNIDFEEQHTALDDAIIESIIFSKVYKKTKGKFEMGITYFPFKILGTVEDFIKQKESDAAKIHKKNLEKVF